MPMKFCLGCSKLTRNGSRCEDCQAEYDAGRNAKRKASAAARGLGRQHRNRAKPVVQAAQVCAICGKPPTPTDPLTADHVIPRVQGGQDGPLRAAHRSCNGRAGGGLRRG